MTTLSPTDCALPVIEKGAEFSLCRDYRYSLWRRWGDPATGYAMFIGLNPSTADESQDDPTIRRCISFARDWGFGALCMTNLFAYRATDPAVMKRHVAPIGPRNDEYLLSLARDAGITIAAWGVHGAHMNRHSEVLRLLPGLQCLAVSKEGFPRHPLYLKRSALPSPFVGR